jgi:hypothetical protein
MPWLRLRLRFERGRRSSNATGRKVYMRCEHVQAIFHLGRWFMRSPILEYLQWSRQGINPPWPQLARQKWIATIAEILVRVSLFIIYSRHCMIKDIFGEMHTPQNEICRGKKG